MNNSTPSFPEYTEIKSIHIGNKLTLLIFEELEHTQEEPFMVILNEDYKGSKITLGVDYFKTFKALVKAYKNKIRSLGVDEDKLKVIGTPKSVEKSSLILRENLILSDTAVRLAKVDTESNSYAVEKFFRVKTTDNTPTYELARYNLYDTYEEALETYKYHLENKTTSKTTSKTTREKANQGFIKTIDNTERIYKNNFTILKERLLPNNSAIRISEADDVDGEHIYIVETFEQAKNKEYYSINYRKVWVTLKDAVEDYKEILKNNGELELYNSNDKQLKIFMKKVIGLVLAYKLLSDTEAILISKVDSPARSFIVSWITRRDKGLPFKISTSTRYDTLDEVLRQYSGLFELESDNTENSQVTQPEREKDKVENDKNNKIKSKFITSNIDVKEEILSKDLVLRVLKLDDTKEKESNYIVQVLKRINTAGITTYAEIKHISCNPTDVMHKRVESIKAEFETNYAKKIKGEESKLFRTEDYETKATSEGTIIREEVISDTEVARVVEAKDKATALNPYTVEIISRENPWEEYESAQCTYFKTLHAALDVYNRCIKAKMLLEVTEVENCDGYRKIKADVISDIKAIRLSRIDDTVSPEPYIIEIFHKLPDEKNYRYKVGNSYKTLDEAEKAYGTQLCIEDKNERIINKYREAHAALKSLALEIAEEQTGNSEDFKRASKVMNDAAKYLETAEWLEKINNKNLKPYANK